MTNEQLRDALKTGFAIVLAVVPLLAAFGPLSQYREVILLIGGCTAAIAAVLGFNLPSPIQQVRNVKASRAGADRMARYVGSDKGQG